MTENYDAIVIGAGQAGPALVARLARAGHKTALIERHLLGLNADEVVHTLLDVMYAKKPFTTIQRAVHIHPTVSELIPTLLGNLEPLV